MVPVNVAVHLIPREEQRLECGESFFDNADLHLLVAANDGEGVEQAVDVDLDIGDAAHERVPAEVIELVQIEGTGDQALKGTGTLAANERHYLVRRVGAHPAAQCVRDRALGDQGPRDLLVMQRANLLERMRKGVVADVVEERGEAYRGAGFAWNFAKGTALIEKCQRP